MDNVRQLSKAWYKFITGCDFPGGVGVASNPQNNRLPRWWGLNTKVLDFSQVGQLSPEHILTYPWYQLVGTIEHLPRNFFPHITGTQVHTLNLGGNAIKDEAAKELATALQHTQVHTLYLRNNQISNEGVKALADALPNTQVRTLSLANNQISDQGVQALADALRNTQVRTLILTNNQIGDQGAAALRNALPNTQVNFLDLASNSISDAEVQKLLEVPKKNPQKFVTVFLGPDYADY